MADLEDLIQRLKAFRDAIPEVMPSVATSVSLSAKALAERTIKDAGFGKKYSTNEVPAFWFYNKWINNRGRDFLYMNEGETQRGNKKIEDITDADLINGTTTWGKFREAQGLQNAYVDLTYSGKMWASIFPGDVQIDLFRYVAPLGSTNTEGKNKMNWNYARYGDFIGLVLVGENQNILYNVAYDELTRLMDEKLQL